ncbi:hypothetical protein [Staphylococcus equorum]|uniref:hypothetical protein n=1 Tax=Staphylococcus equorum TaxID=246432 RepID=UPI002552D2A5|nr:hypothetical protein [Staphylococcus equorum]MDK9849739.1 hypothetical protein [Staphylococcus equorum]
MIEIIITLILILFMALVGACIVQNGNDKLIATRVNMLEEEIDMLEEEIKELRKKY